MLNINFDHDWSIGEGANCIASIILNGQKHFIMAIWGYSFMLWSRNQTTNQIPCSYKNNGFDWPFDLVIVT